MLLYTVTYPYSRSMDKDVPWAYLERLASDRKHDGAVAICTNGRPDRLVLRAGEWTPKEARP